MLDTELRLAAWRNGSTQAERLAAAVLKLSGYEEIDPQHPLGGPDNSRDIICAKGGVTWVGAVHFPTTPVRFAAVKRKFQYDLQGVKAPRNGIAFVTNQHLSVTQRKALTDLGAAASKEVDIFHLERLRALLDSAPAYGVRLQFLGIAMSAEEQLAWFSDSGNQLSDALAANTRELMALKAMIHRIGEGQAELSRTLGLTVQPGLPTPDLISSTAFTRKDFFQPVTKSLDESLLLLFHRLICFDLPERSVGKLRTSDVWLGNADGTRADHVQPPPVVEVAGRLEALCKRWCAGFTPLLRATARDRRSAIARFHADLLVLHPFLDGNGRVARAILMQQCLDLFGRANMSLMDKGARYYAALALADKGDTIELAALIEPIVAG